MRFTDEFGIEVPCIDNMGSTELNRCLEKEKGVPNYWAVPKLTEKDLKKDEGKLRYDLFPVEALEEITKVLTFGASKYADRSWEAGMTWGRCYAALFRHMTAWWMGEDKDQESGISHLAHAGCCLIFLLTYAKRGSGTDDRPSNQCMKHYPQTGENK